MGLSFRARVRGRRSRFEGTGSAAREPHGPGRARSNYVYVEGGSARYCQGPTIGRYDDALPHPREAPRADDVPDSSPGAVLHELDRARRCTELAPFVPLLTLPVVVLSLGTLLFARVTIVTLLASGVAGAASVCALVLLAWLWDRRRCTARLVYGLDAKAAESFLRLQKAYLGMMACGSVWHIPLESRASSLKHGAGATMLFRRYQIRIGLSLPPRVRCNLLVPTLHSENRAFYFFPDRILIYDSRGVHAAAYETVSAHTDQILYVEDETVPSDACVVDATWRYVCPDGSPDLRFGSNRRLPIVVYGELHLHSTLGFDELFDYSKADAADQFASALDAIARGGAEPDGDFWEDPEGEQPGPETADSTAGRAGNNDLYDQALAVVVREGYAALPLLARELRIELSRAATILERMEHDGYIGPSRETASRAVNEAARRYVELLNGAPGRESDAGGVVAGGRARSRSAYEILGVARGASFDEITAAYRHMARMYHPDKVASLAPEYRRIAERRMREINAAYRDLERQAR